MSSDLRCELCGEPIVLDQGRTLTLRHSGDGDGPALAALYQRLSAEDLHLRFFTAGLPPQRWFDRWATIGERGGFGLLVEESTDDGPNIVAEAGYSVLCTGDGELGIAVDPNSRGRLGPWLLDALLRHADAQGVPNVQALVLAKNQRMVALAKSRGTASLSTDDWSTVRLTMSTEGHVPSWPGDRLGDGPHERTRLLVESDRSRWSGAAAATRAGFDVLSCQGPTSQKHGCPLLTDGQCPLADGADVLLHLLDPSVPANLKLLEAHRIAQPRRPIVRGFEATQAGKWHRRSDVDLIKELLEGNDDT